MTNGAKYLKGGIVLLDDAGTVVRALPMLVNPASLQHSFEVKSMGEETGRSSPLRLTGPAVETISFEARMEVSDALARGDAVAIDEGIRPQLAALQMLVTPTTAMLDANDALQKSGALEIVPMTQPLSLFIWGRTQIIPFRLVAFSYTEEFFNARLYPLAATVQMTLRALSVDDLGYSSRGGAIYRAYLRNIEASAARVANTQLATLGIEGAL
ncbi:hypothetical protein RGQ15_21505 [Paracoccus sp. MBLB3053]|uniref:Uncharacterized protein n=1 Tax=Paracoccus aurantius TaxID=3073814 RepID=A0ABU2HYK8_9RHOB|nr:hypothetical protein [Paracoccus sp. MBLB3053]MDS9470133.1 hypothetical protein [Paracoccus sp. MBLB3053]